MGGITSGVGIFSGIDTGTLIEQLLAVESRPRLLMQRRIAELQIQQSAYLDLNSRLGSIRSAASNFRLNNIFSSNRSVSSNEDVLRATAGTSAVPGAYDFVVDRLVTTRQLLSNGFADRDISPIGADSFTFESADARLDRDIELAAFNGGDGISRGKIKVTLDGEDTEIDLSRVATVQDVLDAFNGAGIDVSATVADGHFVVRAGSGQTLSIDNALGSTTATDLGLTTDNDASVDVVEGADAYVLTSSSLLSQLNDGNGVFVSDSVGDSRFDFTINVGDAVNGVESATVNIGGIYDTDLTLLEGPATTIGAVVDRMNAALDEIEADLAANVNLPDAILTAQVGSDGRIEVTSSEAVDIEFEEHDGGTTASDLGFDSGTYDATTLVSGGRLIADLNGTLVRNLNGGAGLTAGDGLMTITARDGTVINLDVSGAETISDILNTINDDPTNAGKVVASLNDAGTGLQLNDTTSGLSNLIVTGDGADSLQIATDVLGVAEDSLRGGDLEHAYITLSTSLSEFNNGRGAGVGTFTVTDGNGVTATIEIGTDTKTVNQLINEINSLASAQGVRVKAAVNDSGDGIVITEDPDFPAGSLAIRVSDETGSVASNLGIEGEASGTDADNFINGSQETEVTFEAGDTLDDLVLKINDAGGQATASIINDGSGGTPYRLSIVSRASGREGRFVLDTKGFDLGLSVLERGEDARVFYGSNDPAKGVLLTSSTNTLDDVIQGVSIDLVSASEDPVTLTVSRDSERVESEIQSFVESYNTLLERIDFQTRFVTETEERGVLLGDSTALRLKQALNNLVQGEAKGLTGQYTRLLDVGITVGEGGKLEINEDRLRTAMDEDYESVAALFETRDLEKREEYIEVAPGIRVLNTNTDDEFSALGIPGMLEELAKDYVDSIDGVLTTRKKTLDTQIEVQEGRIEAFDIRLARKRETLTRSFLAMEQTIALLQSQSASIQQLG